MLLLLLIAHLLFSLDMLSLLFIMYNNIMLYNCHMFIMLWYYMFMLHMHYNSSYSCYMSSLPIYSFMLHNSDTLLLILYYIFMPHNTALLSHNMLLPHLMLSFIMLLLFMYSHYYLLTIISSSNYPL